MMSDEIRWYKISTSGAQHEKLSVITDVYIRKIQMT